MIYFDHAAGMMPTDGLYQRYFDLVREFGTNSEAGHLLGRRSRQALIGCGERIVKMLDLPDAFGVLWFGGAAEAFRFVASTPLVRGRNVVTSCLEHPALRAALNDAAAKVDLLSCDQAGALRLPETPEKAAFVAIHQLQSELGTMPDFARLRAAYPDAVIAADTIQSIGKMALPREASICFCSGSKLGSPAGGAAVIFDRSHPALRDWEARRDAWRKEQYMIDKLHTPELFMIETALDLKLKQRKIEQFQIVPVNRFLREHCAELGAVPTIPADKAHFSICHFHFPGKQGAILVRMLSDAGIMCSAGSACASESDQPSPAMLALGFSREEAYSGLRLSFALTNKISEAERFIVVLGEALRRY